MFLSDSPSQQLVNGLRRLDGLGSRAPGAAYVSSTVAAAALWRLLTIARQVRGLESGAQAGPGGPQVLGQWLACWLTWKASAGRATRPWRATCCTRSARCAHGGRGREIVARRRAGAPQEGVPAGQIGMAPSLSLWPLGAHHPPFSSCAAHRPRK